MLKMSFIKIILTCFIIFNLWIVFRINEFSQLITFIVEFYSNLSQNYRSVTFADISTINPAYAIDPNISDESGFSFDFGFRGQYKKLFSYDVNGFLINYSNRIGFTQKITEIRIDDAQDSIWLTVDIGDGASCHVGYRSCFYRSIPLGPIDDGRKIEMNFVEKEKKFDPEKVYKGQPNPTKI